MGELSKSELKPCPLCGGTPLLSEGPYDWDCGGRYYYNAMIECACGLTLEVDNPGPKVYTDDAEALSFVIDAWNTRAERTCRIENTNGEWRCSCCGEAVGSDDPWCELFTNGNAIELWSYCPSCGAKVVGE